jgi:hypothetical protein
MIAWLDQYAPFKRDGDLLHYLFAPYDEHCLVTIRLLTMFDVELSAAVCGMFVIDQKQSSATAARSIGDALAIGPPSSDCHSRARRSLKSWLISRAPPW